MTLNTIMQNKKVSKYRLSKNNCIPYSTLSDILNGKVRLEKCSAETVYKLSGELQVSMETLLAPYSEKRCGFELFKNKMACIPHKPFLKEQHFIQVSGRLSWCTAPISARESNGHSTAHKSKPMCTRRPQPPEAPCRFSTGPPDSRGAAAFSLLGGQQYRQAPFLLPGLPSTSLSDSAFFFWPAPIRAPPWPFAIATTSSL